MHPRWISRIPRCCQCRIPSWIAFALVLAGTGSAAAQTFVPEAGPDFVLPGQERRHWVAPERRFALDLPDRWEIIVNEKDPSSITLVPADGSVNATLAIRLLKVPKGASARQMVLNVLEQRLRKLPSFREGPRRDVRVSGLPAAVVSGAYYHQGNAQFPRTVEELFVVRGEEAYQLSFDCFEPVAASFAPALAVVYKTFVIRPPGKGGEGAAPPRSETDIDFNRIPF
jgi:hypothetical protein